MNAPVPREMLTRGKKLALLPEEARQSPRGVPITRLTILKRLCQDHEVTDRFVTCLARHTRLQVEEKAKQPGYLSMEEWTRHRELIDRAVAALESHLNGPSEDERSRLWTLFHELVGEQNEHQRIHGGPVRIIKNNDLLLVEYALRTVLADQASLPLWAYQTAAHYASRSDGSHAYDLTRKSAPLLQDVADFWTQEFNLDQAPPDAPPGKEKAKTAPRPVNEPSKDGVTGRTRPRWTPRQGQFLAFIHLYHQLHRQGPAEQDLALYFGVKPAAVRTVLAKLQEMGLVHEKADEPRSLRVSIPKAEIPALEDVSGPPW